MPYSECCGAFSYCAPDIDICPICKEHTDWVYDEDIENEHIDEKRQCKNCEHYASHEDFAIDYCSHEAYTYKREIDDPETCLDDCPLEKKED